MSSSVQSANSFIDALEPSILNNIGANTYSQLESDSENVFEGNLFLQQNLNDEFAPERFFSLTKNYLICYDNQLKNEILFKINFNDIWKLYFDDEISLTDSPEDPEDDDPTYFLFLRSKQQLILLYCPTLLEYVQWIANLTPKCILSNFCNNYKQKQGGKLGGNLYLFSKILDKKEYIVKIFNLQKLQQPENYEFLLSLRNEIIVLRNINHSNIIKLLEIYEGKQNLYLVYEKIEGKSLNLLLPSELNAIEFNSIINQKYQFIDALKYLQSKGINHEAILPQYLFFRNQNLSSEIVLCNFQLMEKEEMEEDILKDYDGRSATVFQRIENIFNSIEIKYSYDNNLRK